MRPDVVSVKAGAPARAQPDGVGVRQRHIVRNTALVGVFFGVAAAAGMLRNIVIARQFGIGADLDAYYAAFRLPDLLFTVVAGGSLATAFIPVFSGLLAADDRAGAWRLASAVTNLVLLTVAALSAVLALAAPALVSQFVAPGFSPAQQAETVSAMRLVLISTLLFGISGVQSSVLHGFKHFFLPALAAALYPLGIAAGALWLAPLWGIQGLAAGAVIGAALHLGVKAPALLRHGFRWWPVLDLQGPHVRRVLLLMGPRVLDLGVFHLIVLVTTNLASRSGGGSVSALEWGWDAMQLPETIIGTAFGLVAFPTLAELAARGDLKGLRATLGETLRSVLALAIPATVGLILLGQPLLQSLYQRGAFDRAATDAVYAALRFYALGLAGHAAMEVVARTFFAREDTVTPLIVAAGAGALNVALCLALSPFVGYTGLALANSVAVTVELLVMLLILRRRLGGIDGQRTLKAVLRIGLASALMAGAVWLVLAWGGGGLLVAALAAGVGAVVYIVSGLLLGVQELYRLPAALLARGP